MKVFIENETGSKIKNIYNEETLEFIKQKEVSAAYPFPYGFVLNTKAEDGDNVDCFVLTHKKLNTGDVVECEPIALMEQFESSWNPAKYGEMEKDHNVLAVLEGEMFELNEEIKELLNSFSLKIFSHIEGKVVEPGKFLDKKAAAEYLKDTTEF